MNKLLLITILSMAMLGCKEKTKDASTEIDADSAMEANASVEKPSDWTELSIDNWQAFKGGPVPKYWHEEEGAILFTPPTSEERKGTDGKNKSFNIVTKNDYTSFVLSFEWKISEGGNSGIMWGVSEDSKYDQPYKTGLEIQLLDNEKHPDAKNGTTHQAGALYDLVEPSTDATKPIGEWNVAVLSVNHKTNLGSSTLNGVEVANFPVGGEQLEALLKGSKFDGWDGFAKFKTGKIALQDHGDEVAFRNIKIKELN